MLLLILEKTTASIGLWIVTPLFKLAAFAFKIFMILAQNDVLKEIKYDTLLTNFYIILGLIMLFIMAFALLRGIVNPDDQKQGTTAVKTIIINFVVSCIMLGFLPTIFPFMFDLQDSILRYNVIGGFFGYGYTGGEQLTDSTNVNEVEASAYRLVNGIYTAFFNVSDGYCTNYLSGNTSGDNDKVYKGKREELEACQQSLAPDSGSELADNQLENQGYDSPDSFYGYKQYVDQNGQFGVYSAFTEQVANGNVDFNFLILVIAGIALSYVGLSYCFDMGLRLIKLIFYQLIAPIPIFLRIIPNSKFSGTFNQWIKVTLTCWMEVFVRIFIFCFCTWLCTAIMETDFLSTKVFEYGRTTGLVTSAFILMAVVMFMKRSPKLLSEITGIDSGNMKLGIREKLSDGGAFVAGAAVGGGITALGRNAVTGVSGIKNKFTKDENGKIHLKEGESKWSVAKGVASGVLGSAVAGGASGFFRSGVSARGKKTFKDTGAAIETGAAKAVEKATKRRNYVAEHNGFLGAMEGHVSDIKQGVGNYFGVGASDANVNIYRTAASTTDASWSVVEGGWKTKKVYQDQEAIVKALKSDMSAYTKLQSRSESIDKALENTTEGSEQWRNLMAEKNEIQNKMQGILANYANGTEYNNAIKKRDELQQKLAEAYNNDSDESIAMRESLLRQYQEADNVVKGMPLSSLQSKIATEDDKLKSIRLDLSKSKTDALATEATKISVDQVTNYLNDEKLANSFRSNLLEAFGAKTLTSDGKFLNANNEEMNMTENDMNIINAMLSGKAIDKQWLDDDLESAYKLQEAMDKINSGRLGIRGEQERKYIEKTRNRSSGGSQSGGKGKS